MGRRKVYKNATEQKRAWRAKQRGSDWQPAPRKTRRENWLDKWRARPFVAIDGEGVDDDEGTHYYTMLTASSGTDHWTITADSLSTVECFDMLLSIRGRLKECIIVGFSVNYDINMILGDVPLDKLKELNTKGQTVWGHYGIFWIPGKIFRLSDYRNAKIKRDGRKQPSRTVTIYDAFGFFQSSFLSTLNAWGVGTKEERELIYSLKKQRGKFNQVDEQSIQEYNTLECVLLVKLMNKLRQALDTAGLYLKSWHGAGAVSGELLKLHEIDKHIEPPPDDYINDAIMRAYFGGRFQAVLLGEIPSSWGHDLKSAYPSAFLDHPSLVGGDWRHTYEFQDTPYSVWRVTWEYPENTPICPFPHRYKRRISYPYSGTGWYWFPEVQNARIFAPPHATLQIHEGYIFQPSSATRPFAFLNQTYAQRKEFVRGQNSAEKVLKLGINGVYGKTAQGTVRGDQTPKFQCYFWAGYCTSITRARVYALAMRNPEAVISFATDGVFATERLTTPDDEGSDLGQWETGPAGYMLQIQSGVYMNVLPPSEGKRISKRVNRKTRGLGRNEVNFARLRKDWRGTSRKFDVKQTIKLRRFFGLQYCLHTNNMGQWRKWIEFDKEVTTAPNDKIYRHVVRGKKQDQQNIRLGQWGAGGVLSEPYEVKGKDKTSDDNDLADYYMDLAQPEFIE